MPIAIPQSPIVSVFRHSSALPPMVWDAFRQHERNANIMYPHADAHLTTSNDASRPQLWLTCSSYHSSTSPFTLDFVLSCTEGPLGSYPIFIFTTAPFDTLLDTMYVYPRIKALVDALLQNIPPERVFSVFAQEPVTRVFTSLWEANTRISSYKAPYYAANLTYCTKQTFVNRSTTLIPGISFTPRLAVESDIDAVASLCQGFAATSEPFTLCKKGARKDAKYLIRRKYLWVLEAKCDGESPEIASIVAATRRSEKVAAITKVYTNPRWRKKGCAERLVRWACRQLLKEKEYVALYVAHNNPAAAGVYHRVGFVGLGDASQQVDGVEPWLEIGFDQEAVRLGHW